MVKNKKKFKKRRFDEARKAQFNVDRGIYTTQMTANPKVIQSSYANDSKSSFSLPIQEIKTDLYKNLLFAVVSILVLVVLSVTRFGYTQLAPLFRF